MAKVRSLSELGNLVAAHYGWAAAKAFKAYQMDDGDRAKLAAAAFDIMKVFPDRPGSSALMSAAFAVRLQQSFDGPVQVVAGTLTVEGEPVFKGSSDFSPAAIANGDSSWSGHVWLMVGPYVADISIFRTAYSSYGPAKLVRHIDLVFGPNKGLYVDYWKRTGQIGLGYQPHRVLSEDETIALMRAAYHLIQQSKPEIEPSAP